jgi:RNA polymerase sigma factor (sigma-70 family)
MTGDQSKARFDSVVLPYLSDAFALARWICKDRADAEDVVQEACLRAFRAIDSYAEGSARAWVLTITRRTAYSWLGKNRSPSLVAIDDLNFDERAMAELGGEQDVSGWATPETELIAKADAAQLEKAIAALPLEFRETLVLRDIQGLEYREVAEVTGAPLGTVMSRLARARRRLMLAIKAER